MEIENFEEKVKLEKTTEEPIFSEPHIINYCKMRLEVYLNGHGTGKGRYLSIYFQLMEGEFDNCVRWPFTKSVTLTLLHPVNSRLDCQEVLKCSDNDDDNDDDNDGDSYDNYYDSDDYDGNEQYSNPDNDESELWGYDEFISHQKLHSDGYIKEDRFFIKCELIK